MNTSYFFSTKKKNFTRYKLTDTRTVSYTERIISIYMTKKWYHEVQLTTVTQGLQDWLQLIPLNRILCWYRIMNQESRMYINN